MILFAAEVGFSVLMLLIDHSGGHLSCKTFNFKTAWGLADVGLPRNRCEVVHLCFILVLIFFSL